MPDTMRRLAVLLIANLNSVRSLEFERHDFGSWQPLPGKCHDNAHAISRLLPGCTVVHGWLCTELAGAAMSDAHSVVECDGKLRDFTPPDAWVTQFVQRRFLPHPGSADDFQAIVLREGINRVQDVPDLPNHGT